MILKAAFVFAILATLATIATILGWLPMWVPVLLLCVTALAPHIPASA